jgi:hypothetical protein
MAVKERKNEIRNKIRNLEKELERLNNIRTFRKENERNARKQKKNINEQRLRLVIEKGKKRIAENNNKKHSYTLHFLRFVPNSEYEAYMKMVGGRNRRRRETNFITLDGRKFKKIQKITYVAKRKLTRDGTLFLRRDDDFVIDNAIDAIKNSVSNVISNLDSILEGYFFENEQPYNENNVNDINIEDEIHNDNVENIIPTSKYVSSIRNDMDITRINDDNVNDFKLVSEPIKKVALYACCFDILIHYFAEGFEKYWNKNKGGKGKCLNKKFDLQYLKEFFNVEGENYGLTIKQFAEFFIKNKLYLVVHNIKGAILYEYRPETENRNVGKLGLHLISYNNHLVACTNNVKSLEQKNINSATLISQPSTFFSFVQDDEELEEERRLIIKKASNEVELLKILFSIKRSVKIIYERSIVEAIKLLMKWGINPSVNGTLLNIKSCSVIFNEIDDKGKDYVIRICIESVNTIPAMTEDLLSKINDEQLLKFQTLQNKLESVLFKKEYCSDRSEDMKMLDKFVPRPLKTSFGDKIMNDYLSGIDRNKSYPSIVSKDIQYIGIFTLMDSLKEELEEIKYDDILHTAFYICQFTDEHLCDEDLILSHNTTYSSSEKGKEKIVERNTFITCGYVLRMIYGKTKSPLKILQSLKPMKTVVNPLSKPFDELFNSDKVDLDMSLKKCIGNVIIGKTRTIVKKSRRSYIDTNKEAVIRSINEVKQLEGFKSEIIEPINIAEQGMKPLYFAIEQVEKELNNGFNCISNYVYMLSRLHVWAMYRYLVKKGIKPLGVNTDCVYFNENDLTDIQREQIMKKCDKNQFGGIKFQEKKPVMVKSNWNLSTEEIEKQSKQKMTVDLDDIWISDIDDDEVIEVDE